jgi:hypothetical protein
MLNQQAHVDSRGLLLELRFFCLRGLPARVVENPELAITVGPS